jgi:translation elongation factor EF-4
MQLVPPPATRGREEDVRVFLFDSWFDKYRGAVNLSKNYLQPVFRIRIGFMRIRILLVEFKVF